jgi:hypothetical protein
MTAPRWCDAGSQSWLPEGRRLLGASAVRHVPLSDEISHHRPKTADSHSISNKQELIFQKSGILATFYLVCFLNLNRIIKFNLHHIDSRNKFNWT